MNQFVPEVGPEDVERVLCRDFPLEVRDEIRRMIEQVEIREKDRIILACLKIAAGDLARARGELANASGWWREILGEAEYPNYTKKMFRIDKLPEAEQAKIIEKDKAQYLAWFNRK